MNKYCIRCHGTTKPKGGLSLASGKTDADAVFGVIYALLFAVWLYVMHSKVQHGPDEPAVVQAETPKKTEPGGLLETASRLHEPESGYSLTSVREQPKQSPAEKE